MVNKEFFVKLNSLKQLCLLVFPNLKTIKQFIIKDVKFVNFYLYETQTQFVISVNSF